MDRKTSEIARRLRSLDLSWKSNSGRLDAIARAVYEPEVGWTGDECEALRETLAYAFEQCDSSEWSDEYLAEVGLMRLPKDADGEYVHINDVMVGLNWEILVVKRLKYSERHGWMVGAAHKDDMSEYGLYSPAVIRHYHKPTLEDVVENMVIKSMTASLETDVPTMIKEFVERIREVIE